MLKIFNRKKTFILSGLIVAGIVFGVLVAMDSRTFANAENQENPEEEIEIEEIDPAGYKYVTVFDNSTNEKKTVRTNAETVAELLDRLQIKLSEADSVDPEPKSTINANNFFVNIYRSRPVIISDGLKTKVIMTSSFDPKVIFLSAGIIVYDGDKINIEKNDNFFESGISTIYKITHSDGQTITTEEEIPYEEKEEKDYNLEVGKSEIRQLGEVGKLEKIYRVFYVDGLEVSRELIQETILREPVTRIVAVGAPKVSSNPLTAAKGRNRYTATNLQGQTVERQETYYDLPMSGVMSFCGKANYTVRSDGAKVDEDGYILVAANLNRYPRCSIVETSLGLGKVYDTGTFASSNPEQFDLATDWTNHDGR